MYLLFITLLDITVSYHTGPLKVNQQPKPSPRTKLNGPASDLDLPDLPSVPDDNLNGPKSGDKDGDEDIDFDDLTRRFEELKKKK